MKNLSKEQQQEIDNLAAELDTLSEEIDTEQDNARESIGKLNEKIQRYNNVVKNASDFRDGVVQTMKDYWASKEEDWQEGDEGEAYQGWIDAMEDLELNKLELVELSDLDERGHSAALSDLPPSPE